MEQIRTIPTELLAVVPKFDGDEGILNLFLKKAKYVYEAFAQDASSPSQKLYVFHALTSKLVGKAARLLSERDDISSWNTLQELLIQHFGDPRSEECIAIELEQIKIKAGESYIELCHRIQHIRSTLFAKVNLLTDEGVKAAKMIVYNNLSLNVFLYNLPEDLIRIVRLKGCVNLENALSIVTEEVNFMTQYNAKNKTRFNAPQPKPLQQFNSAPAAPQNFKFGIPATNQPRFQTPSQPMRYTLPSQPQGFRPNLPTGFRPNFQTQPTGFRFNPNQTQPTGFRFNPNQRFGIPQQGYRPQFNNNNFQRPPFNFKFGIPHHQPKALEDTDVSMRTARPLRQNKLEVPETSDDNDVYYATEAYEPPTDQYNEYGQNYCEEYNEYYQDTPDENTAYNHTDENFLMEASYTKPK